VSVHGDDRLEAVIVSDESPEIDVLKNSLESTNRIKIIGRFTNCNVIHEIKKLNPKVAFLKMEMPGTDGVTIAKRMQEKLTDIKIVFISAYEQYAIQAFEVGAVDYIVKPFKKQRIHKMVSRLCIKHQSKPIHHMCMVCCFKHLHFKINGKEIKKVKWRTAKAKELFTLFIQKRKEAAVRKDVLAELLWPEQAKEKAYEQLYCTIYQIRKTLKSIGANIEIISRDDRYELIFNDVTCDVEEWEKGIIGIPEITEESLPKALKLIKQYTGDYLKEETYVWKENEQERLRVLYQSFSNKVLHYLFENEKYTEASLLALRNQKLFPYLQDSYFILMRIYDKNGDIYNVEKQYLKLLNMLKDEFNTIPNQTIKDWRKKWIEKQTIAGPKLKETL